MRMRYFEPDHADPATFAIKGFFDGMSDRLGEYQPLGEEFIRHIEEFVDLRFGNNQYMTFHQRFDIHKGDKFIAFGYFV